MSEGRWIHGSAIDKKTKELRFASVSSVELADTAVQGCPRKWNYRYVQGIKDPPSKWTDRGIEGHGQVADFFLTGNRNFGPMVSRGTHMLPEPGPDLLVEWDILKRPGVNYPNPLTSAHSDSLLQNAPVKLYGVPFLGNIDMSHARGTNKGAEDVTDIHDPEGTVEVLDWKFVGSDKYLKTPETLRKTTQMVTYAEWVWQVRPQTEHVRLSHGYFLETGRSRKVTTLVTREDLHDQLEHIRGVVRTMVHTAKESDADKVDANTDACSKYGGCIHKGYCKAPMRKSLAQMVGRTAAADLHVPAPAPAPTPTNTTQGIIPVASLLQRANAQAQAKPDAAAIAAERLKIAQAEQNARLKALVPDSFEQACADVRAFNKGFPKLTGTAAQAFMAMGGQAAADDHVVLGTGDIAYVELADANQMAALANDLKLEYGNGPVVPVLPPDAPASDPALATEAPEQTEQTPGQVQETLPLAEATAAPAPAKRGRKPKDQTPVVTAPQAPAPAVSQTPALTQSVEIQAEGAIHLFIDCATSVATTSLNAWAQQVADTLAKKWGALDIRCGGEDTPLGYEKWRGTLMAFARDAKAAPLAPGAYSIDTRYSGVMSVIAEALHLRALESGGSVTRRT